MRYREYGRTGIRVSALGCGALHLPEVSGQIDMERPIAVFRHALDLGVNYVDTAAAYNDGLGQQKQPDGSVQARWAEACAECGACEGKCPQNIPIRERLQETARTLG